jgi:hypothetical protein
MMLHSQRLLYGARFRGRIVVARGCDWIPCLSCLEATTHVVQLHASRVLPSLTFHHLQCTTTLKVFTTDSAKATLLLNLVRCSFEAEICARGALLGFTPVAGVEDQHACDPITCLSWVFMPLLGVIWFV